MENISYDINSENKKIVEEICKKYEYSEELKNVLNRIVDAMLFDATYEERMSFFNMLKRTPIIIQKEGNIGDMKKLTEKYIGKLNPHIIEDEKDWGEYSKNNAPAFFATEPIIDENLNLIGSKQCVVATEVDDLQFKPEEIKRRCKLFESKINIPYLIHELGHAWASEVNQYKLEGNILTQRTGTCKLKYELQDLGNGKYLKKEISREGLMTEESINTNMEQEAIARYLKISKKDLSKLYVSGGCIDTTEYQGTMADITEALMEKTMKREIRNWRIGGSQESLDRINEVMKKTSLYQNRGFITKEDKRKREIFDNPDSKEMSEFFDRCRKDFFPSKEDMFPMDMIENVLLQCYDVKTNKFVFNIFNKEKRQIYFDLLLSVVADGYNLINQTSSILKDEEQKSDTDKSTN